MIKFQKPIKKKIIAVVLLIFLLYLGYSLSIRKPLWNDEMYSQVTVIDQVSYKDIMLIRFGESVNSPTFYFIQKFICDLTGYKFTKKWYKEWEISDLRSQIILRIASNIFMSLSIVFIFYYFAACYSGWIGIYAILVSLSSYMVWAHWAEARPYAIWFCLTGIQ